MTRQDLITELGRAGIANSTRQHMKSLYFGFWTWVQDEQYRLDNPAVRLPRVIVHKQEANPITTDDLEIVINSGIYSKTRMYVLLYAYQGFRAVEIAAVDGAETIDWDRRRILSRNGKGGREVWRPMHPVIWEEAQKYPRNGPWFPSPIVDGATVTPRNVSAVLSKAFRRAGIMGHRPHNLRAWYATELGRAGAPTAVVAAGLRHTDMQSVDRYLAVDQEAIEHYQDQLPRVKIPERTPRPATRGSYRPRKVPTDSTTWTAA